MKRTLVVIGAVLALLVAGFLLFNAYIYNEKQEGPAPEPYRATLSGVQVCLPHKDTSGPQTLECALGMKTDVGEYYALDFNSLSEIPSLPNGQRFTASGTITPIELLSTDHWQKYQVSGILSVTDVESIEPAPAQKEPVVVTPPKPAGKCYVGGCSSQLCSDQPGLASTCEYTEAYGCYKTATCERQANGACGWTQTAELASCLANAR